MQKGFKWLTTIVVAALLIFLLVARWGAHLYIDWLWYQSLGYINIFKTILLSEIGLRLLVGLSALIFIFVNLILTRKSVLQSINARQINRTDDDIITIYQSPLNKYLTPRLLTLTYLAISTALAFFVSSAVTGDWVIVQKYLHSTTFGVTDPIFNNDIGKYVFNLPFYLFLYQLITWFIILSAFTVALVYFLSETGKDGVGKVFNSMAARLHLSFLAALFFLVRAWGYRLEQYMLLYSGNGVTFGPGYTDIHARLLAYKALFFIALLIALVIIINIFLRRFKLILYSIGGLILASIILGGIYPSAVQNLIVKPNELNKESPYIANSIKYTRMAYNLNQVQIKKFPAGQVLSAADIENNRETVNNIRLWDWRPLRETYQQLQEIRPYYELENIDIDRYTINGEYRQVMLAARELDQAQLSSTAKTWINERLKYTHGYGVTMNPVNKMTSEGLPELFIKNIPPSSEIDVKVTRPEIYFGELTDNYVIVNTKTQEFDYPVGTENAYTTYEGKNGVKVNNFLRKAVFALAFADYKLLLASDLENSSQILYYRNIKDRVTKLAPFLSFDSDPYIVIDNSGALHWMWDAYTTTNMYPYSEPYRGGNNYIRNAVKVIINAYTGQVDFYVSDNEDPIIQTYAKIFPGVFKPLSEMPGDLREHIRYPADLFNIQAEKYTVFHMTNTEVLYNQEDRWNIPTEKFYNEEVTLEPYYNIIKLPESEKPEYVLILPFTPNNKTNMIGWMAARSDDPNYGELLVYEFPKQELVYGPMQIEARIDQDTVISQQLTLWNQRGSSVIRGNLLVIPVENSLLYVEPLYLQSEQSRMPELRRVIVAHNDRIVMEPTLDTALNKIFGTAINDTTNDGQQPSLTDQEPVDKAPATLKELIDTANNLYNEAQTKLQNGDWAGYGEAIGKLEKTLKDLSAQAE
ncbi:UPF0182 family protein [Desulfallas thermosapovorans]|uniref:UPF0182 protein LX24_00059 n=1 Tax=Desulfallas thermosapovorans DSM 6562 TaxID=1121431 RepID=A0A5S4ZYE0_9FIRM|nr:UPF0182 family protein [Desulfallas thermosapovorans]TYO97776.1 hypothetical protein LX24_00059 [Desulfallas thermosapovorans DSM 6562]